MIFPISTIAAAVPALFAASVLAIPTPDHSKSPFQSTTGFSGVTYSTSAGGNADCLEGFIQVPVTSTNQKLRFDSPADQYAVTASFLHYLQANTTQPQEIAGGSFNVSETFNIAAKLCYPKNWSPSSSSKTIQFLTHGIGFNQSYWDFAQGYSFIDVAAKAGYPTFSHDRLGVGASDHPDPIQIVQAPIQVEIIHQLVSFLKAGKLAGTTFQNVVAVGHSFGSIQSAGVAAKYPKDFDALVLTGFSTDMGALQLTFADFNTAIARLNQPDRFKDLPNGYLVVDSAIGNQFAFFYYPNFDVEIFLKDDASKQTFTYGEIFTLTSVVAPSPAFTGPVDAVIGEFDYIFAQGNASYSAKYYPANQAQLVQPALFPNASNGSESYIVPGAGHAINLHYEAGQMFDQVQAFVKKNSF